MYEVRFKQKTYGQAVAFYVSQLDVGRQIQAKLDVLIATGHTIKLEGTKPSGETFSETCTPRSYGCSIQVTEQITNEPGISRAQIVLYGPDGERMGSEQVQIWVEPLGGVA